MLEFKILETLYEVWFTEKETPSKLELSLIFFTHSQKENIRNFVINLRSASISCWHWNTFYISNFFGKKKVTLSNSIDRCSSGAWFLPHGVTKLVRLGKKSYILKKGFAWWKFCVTAKSTPIEKWAQFKYLDIILEDAWTLTEDIETVHLHHP